MADTATKAPAYAKGKRALYPRQKRRVAEKLRKSVKNRRKARHG